MAWVYVFSHSDSDGYYKVGFTARTPEERLKEMKTTGLPMGYYEIEYTIELKKDIWAEKIERKAHKILSRSREQGEWFSPSGGLDEIIEAVNKAYESLSKNEIDENEEYLRLKEFSEKERARILQEKEKKEREYFLKRNELVQKYKRDKEFIEDSYKRFSSDNDKKQSYWNTFPIVVVILTILLAQKNELLPATIMSLFLGLIINYFVWGISYKEPQKTLEYKQYKNDLECLKNKHERELLNLESKYKF